MPGSGTNGTVRVLGWWPRDVTLAEERAGLWLPGGGSEWDYE